jgi:hypothetical protein
LACLGGIVGLGCLISIISAGRRTAAGELNRYQVDERKYFEYFPCASKLMLMPQEKLSL